MRLWELEGGDDGEFGHGFGGGDDIQLPLDVVDEEVEEPARGPGLQQFLRMARNDEEDE